MFVGFCVDMRRRGRCLQPGELMLQWKRRGETHDSS